MVKILVVFYSRTGNTAVVGKEIAIKMGADVDEIRDLKNRGGFLGYLGAGFDAMFSRLTEIKNKKNPEKYNLVILGGPVWAGKMTPAVRTYFTKYEFKNIAFFCSCGGENGSSFREMAILSKNPLATLEVYSKEVDSGLYREKVGKFVDILKKEKLK